MKTSLLYMTSPKPGVFVVNLQPEGWDQAMQYEVSEDQLKNFVGAYLALKKQSVPNRVSATLKNGDAHEQHRGQQQRTA